MDITKTEAIEARQFFRINDRLDFTYRLATTDELADPNYAFDILAIDEKHHSLLEALVVLGKDADQILNKISENDALLANYLRVMDHKILLLTKELIYKADIKKAQPRQVNLSESGIAFGCNEELEINSHLRMTMLLPPITDGVAIYGKIVRLEASANNPTADPHYHNWVAVQFTSMQNADRQLLARYILYKQIAERKSMF